MGSLSFYNEILDEIKAEEERRSPIYYGDNKVRYTVLPYSLKETINSYLKHDKLRRLVAFLLNSRLTEKSARKYAEKKSK